MKLNIILIYIVLNSILSSCQPFSGEMKYKKYQQAIDGNSPYYDCDNKNSHWLKKEMQIESLTISGNCDTKDFKIISGFTKLKHLTLREMIVHNEIIKSFGRFKLESLNISYCQLKPNSIKAISRMKQLDSLELFQTFHKKNEKFFDPEQLSHLKKLKKLRHLGIYECFIGFEAVIQIERLLQLNSLALGNNYRGYFFPDPLSSEEIKKMDITDDSIKLLGKLKKLKHLWLSGNHFTNKAYEYLNSLKHLNSLTIYRNGFINEDFSGIEKLMQIKQFSYSQANSSKVLDLRPLAKLRLLESLCINLYFDGSNVIQNKEKLKELFLTPLSQLKNLQILELEHRSLDYHSSPYIEGLKNLEFLYLENTRFSKKDAWLLKHKLPHCKIRLNSPELSKQKEEQDLLF